MKNLLLLFIFLSFLSCNSEPYTEVQQETTSNSSKQAAETVNHAEKMKRYAEVTGQKLKNCCSQSAKNLTINIENSTIDNTNQQYIIKMRVSWIGGISEQTYWILGELKTDLNGCNASWLKLDEEGIFASGCGSKCVLECVN